ncbi:hypothetical protein PAHAL_9G155500 [Panicum hallii]|uniref:Uncharacterized protein n=1 Tax=Panicum hallii TaxID=206008 RepID=A0A2T8I1H6_9POAL|nr:hypothetical protein PAHAL_9G155500 [Panicum hallii]
MQHVLILKIKSTIYCVAWLDENGQPNEPLVCMDSAWLLDTIQARHIRKPNAPYCPSNSPWPGLHTHVLGSQPQPGLPDDRLLPTLGRRAEVRRRGAAAGGAGDLRWIGLTCGAAVLRRESRRGCAAPGGRCGRWRLASPRGRVGAWRLAARRGRAAPCLEAGAVASGAWRVEAKAAGLDRRTAEARRAGGRAGKQKQPQAAGRSIFLQSCNAIPIFSTKLEQMDL